MSTLLSQIAAEHIADRNVQNKYAGSFYLAVASFSAHVGHDATTDDLHADVVNRWIERLHLESSGDFRRRCLVILWNRAVRDGLAEWHGRLKHLRPKVAWTLNELQSRADSEKGVTLREFLECYLRAANGYAAGHMVEMVRLVEQWRKQCRMPPMKISDFSQETLEGLSEFVDRKRRRYSELTRRNRILDFKRMWLLAEQLGLAGPSGMLSTRILKVRYGFVIPPEEWEQSPLSREEIELGTRLPSVIVNCLFKLNFRIQSEKTRAYYRQGVRDYAGYLNRVPIVADLNDDSVAGFLTWLRDDRKLPNVSVNDRRKIIIATWSFLCKLGVLTRWPLIPKLPEPEPVPQAWTLEQLRTLFFACGEQRGKINGAPAGVWWQSLISAMWDTSERIGAMLSLKWEHVDLNGRWLHVPAGIRKGGKKPRSYKISETTYDLLKRLRVTKSDFVWNRKAHHSTYFYGFERILRRAGLPHDRSSKFHRIRRSVSSHLEAMGVNSSEILGHDERSTTVKSYIDRTIAPQRQAVDLLGSINSPGTQPAPSQPSDTAAVVQLIAQLTQQVTQLTAALAAKGGAA